MKIKQTKISEEWLREVKRRIGDMGDNTVTTRTVEQISGTLSEHSLYWPISGMVGWFLEFYIFATSEVISEQVPSCESVHSCQLNSAATFGIILTPATELTSPCSILLMLSAGLGRDKYKFVKSLLWLDWEPNSKSPAHEVHALPIQPPYPVVSGLELG